MGVYQDTLAGPHPVRPVLQAADARLGTVTS